MREELEPMGVVTLADGSALERIVWLRVQCRRLRKQLEAFVGDGFAFQSQTSHRPLPQVKTVTDWHAALARLEAEFGLTPSARARVNVTPGASGSPDGPQIAARTRSAG